MISGTDVSISYTYTHASICKRDEYNCRDGFFTDYCPNEDTSCDEYIDPEEDPYFFCNISGTCIYRGMNPIKDDPMSYKHWQNHLLPE